MSREILEAMHALAREKGIEPEKLMVALEDALLSAYKKQPGSAKYARVEMDRDTADFRVIELIIPERLEAHLIVETIDEQTTIDPETGEMREPEEPEIDALRLHARRPFPEAEVDQDEPPVPEDHVRCREVPVDDVRPVETRDRLPDLPAHLVRAPPARLEDGLRGGAVDELHHEPVLGEVDVVQDRDRDARRAGLANQLRLRADAGLPQLLVQRGESVPLRDPGLLHGLPAEVRRAPELRLGPALQEHGASDGRGP